MRKTLLIAEDVSEPIDEGVKKFSFYLAKYVLELNTDSVVFSAYANKDLPDLRHLPKNKLLFSVSFFRIIYSFRPEMLVYIPSASSTLMSFIRLSLMALFIPKSRALMVSLQERKHSRFSKGLISLIKPDQIVVLSRKEANYYKSMGFDCFVSPIGVETGKYLEINPSQKRRLREKLNLPIEGRIILHVGHINKGRNLEILKGLIDDGFHIVIVVSTRYESDLKLKSALEDIGYLFITSFIKDIEEYYQASDIYVFPVESATNAMEFPMSVLEAMSCNLPVLTTRFGGIESFLAETDWIKYFESENELRKKILTIPQDTECENRNLVLSKFAWSNVVSNLFENKNLQ
jgi:glycosyltransferase involved in cell wall biosynthesis